MKIIILILYLLTFSISFSVAQKFLHDEKCLYEEPGTSFTFNITPQIDFFIPHNWVNNEENLNSLQIKLSPTNLVLRHPLSTNKGPGEISLPLQSMKVGWNRLYLKKDGNNLQVIERTPDNSVKVIQNITFEPGQDPLHVSGLYSLANCFEVDGSVSPKEKPTVVQPIENITDKGCGRNTKKSQLDKIIGGRPADPKDWPWMAALLKVNDSSLICGGVLITDRYVLTAAHCFKDFKIDQIKVRLGEYDFGTTTENNHSDFRIERRDDPHYILETRDNDLALLRLERSTSFGEFISPVCLPPRFETFETRRGIIVGWGTQQVGGSFSNILREVAIPILRRRDCESRFSRNSITPNMFCASLRGLDSCQGDSGGPFMIQQDDSRWYVVGIVSWGIGCGHISLPGVYTKVNNYLDWIQRNIEP
ncbi:UNVERIFIED_CONTAM: hypothetical protein RMT77_001866 [Armadillidium vulgare]